MYDYKYACTVYLEIKRRYTPKLTFIWHIGKHFER